MKPILTCIALAASLLAACNRNISCPAYDNNLMDTWFPYTTNGMYYFSSAAGQSDTLMISQVYKSEHHVVRERSSIYKTETPRCNIQASIQSKTGYDAPNWIYFRVVHQISSPGEAGTLQLRFRDMPVMLEPDADLQTLVYADFKLTTLENITLNGVTYDDVRLIEPATIQGAANAQLDKLYIARGKGIIGYRTYPDGVEYWVK